MQKFTLREEYRIPNKTLFNLLEKMKYSLTSITISTL